MKSAKEWRDEWLDGCPEDFGGVFDLVIAVQRDALESAARELESHVDFDTGSDAMPKLAARIVRTLKPTPLEAEET